MKPRIGIDFDNTIVCYDGLFHRLAVEQGLIPAHLPATKLAVRNHLRAAGLEPRWTALQGLAYGSRMADAEPFPGVGDFFLLCARLDIPTLVISHRTRQPIDGPPCDLHEAARTWLKSRAFPMESACFEETRDAKVARIRHSGCTHFIDDLPEVLEHPDLPPSVEKILFDPARTPWGEMAARCGLQNPV